MFTREVDEQHVHDLLVAQADATANAAGPEKRRLRNLPRRFPAHYSPSKHLARFRRAEVAIEMEELDAQLSARSQLQRELAACDNSFAGMDGRGDD